jgi:hypothetical protein
MMWNPVHHHQGHPAADRQSIAIDLPSGLRPATSRRKAKGRFEPTARG